MKNTSDKNPSERKAQADLEAKGIRKKKGQQPEVIDAIQQNLLQQKMQLGETDQVRKSALLTSSDSFFEGSSGSFKIQDASRQDKCESQGSHWQKDSDERVKAGSKSYNQEQSYIRNEKKDTSSSKKWNTGTVDFSSKFREP